MKLRNKKSLLSVALAAAIYTISPLPLQAATDSKINQINKELSVLEAERTDLTHEISTMLSLLKNSNSIKEVNEIKEKRRQLYLRNQKINNRIDALQTMKRTNRVSDYQTSNLVDEYATNKEEVKEVTQSKEKKEKATDEEIKMHERILSQLEEETQKIEAQKQELEKAKKTQLDKTETARLEKMEEEAASLKAMRAETERAKREAENLKQEMSQMLKENKQKEAQKEAAKRVQQKRNAEKSAKLKKQKLELETSRIDLMSKSSKRIEDIKKLNRATQSINQQYIDFAGPFEKFEINHNKRHIVGGTDTPEFIVNGEVVNNDFRAPDNFKDQYPSSNATFFAYEPQNKDFVRVSTSLTKADGSRAIGTYLGQNHPGYKNFMEGRNYIGLANLFGTEYMTKYVPVFNAEKDVIGVLYIGIEF